MRKHTHLILSLLVPAFLVLSGHAVVKAQQKTSSTAKGKRWSDAATWPDKKVPGKDAVVTIDGDMDVVLDVSPPQLHGLTINGKLSFADNKDLELTTEWIMVHGELEIGTEAKPHTRNATITLTDNVKGEDISGVGGTTNRVDRGIMLMGGTLNLHSDRTNSWTKLSSTANAGATSIQVLNGAGWRVRRQRSFSHPRISIPGRRNGATLRPSMPTRTGETRSRSTRSSTTCTSARSPSTWMNAAKSAC